MFNWLFGDPRELRLERRSHDLLKVEHYKLLRAYNAVLAERAELEREIARLSATPVESPIHSSQGPLVTAE